ncbi:hypothetical protein K8I85_14175 [bacterium]|nr:hypothetical protein [bacterium]
MDGEHGRSRLDPATGRARRHASSRRSYEEDPAWQRPRWWWLLDPLNHFWMWLHDFVFDNLHRLPLPRGKRKRRPGRLR